jgi:hypothetical protein
LPDIFLKDIFILKVWLINYVRWKYKYCLFYFVKCNLVLKFCRRVLTGFVVKKFFSAIMVQEYNVFKLYVHHHQWIFSLMYAKYLLTAIWYSGLWAFSAYSLLGCSNKLLFLSYHASMTHVSDVSDSLPLFVFKKY